MEAVFNDEGGWRSRFVHMHERIKEREHRVKSKYVWHALLSLSVWSHCIAD